MPSTHHGIEVPDLTDPPNAPAQLRAMVDSGGAVPRFATLADARTAYPAGQRPVGMLVGIGTRLYTSNGTDFVSVSAGGIENFATSAARAAAITNPALNQVTTLDSRPTVQWMWDGTRWVPSQQSGVNVLTTNGAGGYALTYPVPFRQPPVVSLTDQYSASTRLLVHALILDQSLATGFGAVVRNVAGGGVWASGLTRVHWTASVGTQGAN